MASIEAPVNAAVLAWARRTAGVAGQHAAKTANVTVERLLEWEKGTSRPSIAQLRHLADLYKRPLAVFFLKEVPKDFAVMKSFRRLPLLEETGLSHQLAIQTRQALVRREIALELAADTGWNPPSFSLSAALATPAVEVAQAIRQRLGVTLADQMAWENEREAYKAWRSAIEEWGVLTFQVVRVTVEEMRGLSLFQDTLPIILVNSADAMRGRIFSLLHELGHLLLRETHLCEVKDGSAKGKRNTEVWCNEFAGALLLPEEALAKEYKQPLMKPKEGPDWEGAKRLADLFKVSQEVVLRRLRTSGRMSQSAYAMGRARLLESEKLAEKPKRKGTGGPPPDLQVVWNLGMPFVRTVLEAMNQHRITLNDVSDYLDVKVRHVPKIQERVILGALRGDEAQTGL
jgi:Zn-dependent peptidase ImmA (M78 family)/DNA-binding XRE family transcriptional regulator